MSKVTYLTILVFLTAGVSSAWAIPAFPGAEGFGAITPGGRGGDVYHITSLDDTSGTVGTLRHAISSATGPRTIVFDTSGIIYLQSELRVTNPYLTIAGQTAPGDGICIAGETLSLDAHDIILRHLRVRRGSTGRSDDALSGDPSGNIIIDHCSVSWGFDETLSIYRYKDPWGGYGPTQNVTIQWSIISEGLNLSGHAFGATWGGTMCSYHHNLFACNTGRNPSLSYPMTLDFRNNVLYNWRHRSIDGGDDRAQVNIVNNYYKPGPATYWGDVSYRIVEPQHLTYPLGPGSAGWWYVTGNYVEGYPWVTGDNWSGGVQFEDAGMDPNWARSYTPFTAPPIVEDTAEVAYQRVLAEAGDIRPIRDAVDTRIAGMVAAGTVTFGDGIIDTPADVGGYPAYPVETRPAGFDTDNDGMPDDWEIAHGMNPSDADHDGDFDNDGYTNLEEYINELGWFSPNRTILWTGGTTNRYERIDSWDIPWQPTVNDQVEINSGKATVSYDYQEAGMLRVANTPGAIAELAGTAGKLTIAKDLHVGGAADSRGTVSVGGGVIAVGGSVVLGGSGGARGLLNLTDGSLGAANLYVGHASGGMGEVAVRGGRLSVAKDLYVGMASGAYGTVSLRGWGEMIVGGCLALGGGSGGQGVMNITNGWLETGNVSLGNSAYASGTLTVSGGELMTSRQGWMIDVGGAAGSRGTVALSDGDIYSGLTVVGDYGTGEFVQTGGIHQCSWLSVGHSPGGVGDYILSEGLLGLWWQLTVGYNGVGRFMHSGGEVNVSDDLLVGVYDNGEGTYRLSGGGKVEVGGSVSLGHLDRSRGVMDLLGGSLTVVDGVFLAAGVSSTAELKVAKGAYVHADRLRIRSGEGRSTKVTVEVAADGSSLMYTTGTSTLAGALDVQSLGGFRPREGDQFTLISSSDPKGIYYWGDFASLASNITTGLPEGLSAFGGLVEGGDYRVVFQGYTDGDATGDHKVNEGDFSLLVGSWYAGGGKTWGDGDFTGDGLVDEGDFSLLAGNWSWTLPPGAPTPPVPEPASAGMLLVSVLGPLVRRRRR